MSVTLRDADNEFVISSLTDQATNSVVGSSPYFRNLILQADLPKSVLAKNRGLTGSPDFDARNLAAWSLNYGINPRTRISVLGSFIMAMMKLAGFDQQLRLAAIIVANHLVPQDQLDRLRFWFHFQFRQLQRDNRRPTGGARPKLQLASGRGRASAFRGCSRLSRSCWKSRR